jgi:hypothetical protein
MFSCAITMNSFRVKILSCEAEGIHTICDEINVLEEKKILFALEFI